jgi:hypothetical protein
LAYFCLAGYADRFERKTPVSTKEEIEMNDEPWFYEKKKTSLGNEEYPSEGME